MYNKNSTAKIMENASFRHEMLSTIFKRKIKILKRNLSLKSMVILHLLKVDVF